MAIRPNFPSRLRGSMAAGGTPSLIAGYSALDGPRFRVGYQAYVGVSAQSFRAVEGDGNIGHPLRLTPPSIPRRSASPPSVRNGIMAWKRDDYRSFPVVMPRAVRR